jgi:predicted nucleotidyltransferase
MSSQTIEFAEYVAGARQRWLQEQRDLARRRERAWTLARQAAHLLREQYGVTRVSVFGSLTHEGRFTRWSDVDIAAWGLARTDAFRAMSDVAGLDDDIAVNLADANSCRPEILARIEQEGAAL